MTSQPRREGGLLNSRCFGMGGGGVSSAWDVPYLNFLKNDLVDGFMEIFNKNYVFRKRN